MATVVYSLLIVANILRGIQVDGLGAALINRRTPICCAASCCILRPVQLPANTSLIMLTCGSGSPQEPDHLPA